MHRRLIATLLLGLTASACTDFNSSLYIEGSVIGALDDDQCTWTAAGSLQPSGRYNVEYPASYQIFPLYNNQLRARPDELSADPNGLHIRGVEVEIMDAGRTPLQIAGLPNPFSIPTSTFVPASSDGRTPGEAVGSVVIVPEIYREALAGSDSGTILVIGVTPFGRTVGGEEVDGSEWQWVIELCKGTCLFVCPGVGDSEDIGGCTPGQDQEVLDFCGCGTTHMNCIIGDDD